MGSLVVQDLSDQCHYQLQVSLLPESWVTHCPLVQGGLFVARKRRLKPHSIPHALLSQPDDMPRPSTFRLYRLRQTISVQTVHFSRQFRQFRQFRQADFRQAVHFRFQRQTVRHIDFVLFSPSRQGLVSLCRRKAF